MEWGSFLATLVPDHPASWVADWLERARAGESRQASRTSTDDLSSGRRGGLRSRSGPGGRTRDQLYAEARSRNIAGRSKMTKAELERALDT